MDRGWKQTSSSVLSDKAQSDGSGAFLELDRLGGGTANEIITGNPVFLVLTEPKGHGN